MGTIRELDIHGTVGAKSLAHIMQHQAVARAPFELCLVDKTTDPLEFSHC